MQPRQLSILGVGLLGGSLGLAARRAWPNCRIIGYGHRAQTLRAALDAGAIDHGETDPAAAVAAADCVVLCTPVGLFQSLLRDIAPALKNPCIVTDVGSTKRSIVHAAGSILPAHAPFVGSHPMAGSEKRGVEHARADLFDRAACILTPTPTTDPDALHQIDFFWQTLGMRTVRCSPELHDQYLASVSHLPHVLAAALVAMQAPGPLALAGKGFLDATRIAAGDGALWRDILLDNADNVRAALALLQSELAEVTALLDARDADRLRQWLDTAAARRQSLSGAPS